MNLKIKEPFQLSVISYQFFSLVCLVCLVCFVSFSLFPEELRSPIIAIDIHQLFLQQLEKYAQQKGLENYIQPMVGDIGSEKQARSWALAPTTPLYPL